MPADPVATAEAAHRAATAQLEENRRNLTEARTAAAEVASRVAAGNPTTADEQMSVTLRVNRLAGQEATLVGAVAATATAIHQARRDDAAGALRAWVAGPAHRAAVDALEQLEAAETAYIAARSASDAELVELAAVLAEASDDRDLDDRGVWAHLGQPWRETHDRRFIRTVTCDKREFTIGAMEPRPAVTVPEPEAIRFPTMAEHQAAQRLNPPRERVSPVMQRLHAMTATTDAEREQWRRAGFVVAP